LLPKTPKPRAKVKFELMDHFEIPSSSRVLQLKKEI